MTSSSIHQLYHRAWAVPLLIGGGALTLLLVGAYRVAVTPLSMLIERLVQQCAMGVAALLTSTTLAQLGVGAVAAIVALTFFVSLAIQIFRTRRLLTTLTMCKAAVRDTRTRAHYTVLTTETPMCFTAGLLRPQIFVSTGTLDRLTAPEFASVLAHEAHHQAHRDPMKTMILRAFSHAFFFLPLFRAFVDRMKTTNEIAADAAALALPGGRSALATALYALSHHRAPSMATVASFAQSGTIDVRLEFMGGRGYSPLPIAISKIVVSIVTFILLVVPFASISRAETAVSPCGESAPFVHPLRSPTAPLYSLPPVQSWTHQQ